MAIQTLNTIKKWFKTGLKPSQDQFWDTWDSFRHKFEKIQLGDIEKLETILDSKAEKSQLEEHKINQDAHIELFSVKENKSEKGIAGGYVPLDQFSKIISQYLNIVNDLTTGGSESILSAEQGVILQNQINSIHTLLSSDNVDLDTLQKIVDAIEEVQISLNTILVNDLSTGGVTKALTAEMGKQLNEIKLTATISTDAETQINKTVLEDNKVISRSKLVNWWEWIKEQSQTITGSWTFTKAIKASHATEVDELTTLDQVINLTTLNSILRRDSSAGKENSSINLLSGTPSNRYVSMVFDDINIKTHFYINLYDLELQGYNKQTKKSAGVFINYGLLSLKQINDDKDVATSIILENPQIESRYIFKAPTVSKDYFVATTDDIPAKTPDATNVIKGIIQLGGDLEGTADAPTVKGLNGKLTATIATDEQAQITAPIVEDNKVISRSKLYNWWNWIKTLPQEVYNTWTFYGALRFGSAGNLYGDADSFYVRSFQNKQLYLGVEGLAKDSLLINNDGITANSQLTLSRATKTVPSLIIHRGSFITDLQDGAVENVLGNLYYTDGSARLKLLNQRDTDNFLQTTWRSTSNRAVSFSTDASYTNKTNVTSFSLPNTTLGGSDAGNYLFKTFDKYFIRNSSYDPKLIPPTSVLFEMYLKGINCLFSGNEYVRLYSTKRTDIMTNQSIRNYEIPLEVSNVYSQGNFLSGLTYSELEFDNLGNIANETFRSYYLKSSTYSGPAVGDLKFSNASIALEIRISCQYDDALNSNKLNDGCKSIYYNTSSLFLKI